MIGSLSRRGDAKCRGRRWRRRRQVRREELKGLEGRCGVEEQVERVQGYLGHLPRGWVRTFLKEEGQGTGLRKSFMGDLAIMCLLLSGMKLGSPNGSNNGYPHLFVLYIRSGGQEAWEDRR